MTKNWNLAGGSDEAKKRRELIEKLRQQFQVQKAPPKSASDFPSNKRKVAKYLLEQHANGVDVLQPDLEAATGFDAGYVAKICAGGYAKGKDGNGNGLGLYSRKQKGQPTEYPAYKQNFWLEWDQLTPAEQDAFLAERDLDVEGLGALVDSLPDAP